MDQKSQRIRIDEKGWSNYSGFLGGVEFHNALSVNMVDPMQATRLGSLIRIVKVDTDEQAGGAADYKRIQTVEAEVVPESERGLTDSQAVAPQAPVNVWTAEQLAAIADKQGIAGLREIAEPMGVKGRGIAELIEEIQAMQASKAPKAV